jgi:hypothetical protein
MVLVAKRHRRARFQGCVRQLSRDGTETLLFVGLLVIFGDFVRNGGSAVTHESDDFFDKTIYCLSLIPDRFGDLVMRVARQQGGRNHTRSRNRGRSLLLKKGPARAFSLTDTQCQFLILAALRRE